MALHPPGAGFFVEKGLVLCPGNTLNNSRAAGTGVLECGSLLVLSGAEGLPPSSRQLAHGKLTLSDTTVHKVNGKPRFTYEKKDNYWERVKAAN